jgi:hypothetical protein
VEGRGREVSKKDKQVYEYEYQRTEDGGFGTGYVETDSVAEAQKKLLEVSKGGDVEVTKVKRVK